jgi:hypothetical protein
VNHEDLEDTEAVPLYLVGKRNKGALLTDTIDNAMRKLLIKIEDKPPDLAAKIMAQAIAWMKVKHQIKDKGEDEFDPDKI